MWFQCSGLRDHLPEPRSARSSTGWGLTLQQHALSPVLAENLPAWQWGLCQQNSTEMDTREVGRVGGSEADGESACDNPQDGAVLTQQNGSLPHVKSMVHGQVLTVQFFNSSII